MESTCLNPERRGLGTSPADWVADPGSGLSANPFWNPVPGVPTELAMRKEVYLSKITRMVANLMVSTLHNHSEIDLRGSCIFPIPSAMNSIG